MPSAGARPPARVGEAHLRRSRGFQVSVRVVLALGVIVAVALTAALVHVPWYFTARSNTFDLIERLNARIIADIGRQIDGLLENAVGAGRAIATNVTEGVVDIDDVAKREYLFLSFLQSQPSLSSIAFGWPDDRSFAARRTRDGSILMDVAAPVPGEHKATLRTDRYGIDAQGMLDLETTAIADSPEVVTEEYWYQAALLADPPVWSNIYPMSGDGRLGVTTTRAIVVKDQLIGVLGVSIDLDRLAQFLDGIDVGYGGTVFLTNIYDELVATQSRMAPPRDGAAGPSALRKLEQVDLPPVRVAAAALAANAIDLRAFDRARQLVYRDGGTGETWFVAAAPLAQMGLVACIVIPASVVLHDIDRNTRLLLYAVLGFIALMAAGATFAARRVLGRPLVAVTANVERLDDLHLDGIRPVSSHLTEIARLSTAIVHMGASLSSFSKYVPTELVRTLFAQGMEAKPGGERRDLTILFMDLADFTGTAEALGEALIPYLGDYLTAMSDEIQAQRGTIDKYIGDAVMAFWGAPIANADHALSACRAALACQARLAEMRAVNRAKGLPEPWARIGINSGRVLVGNVGSRDRLNYTVIGDPVNVASRLESLNKVYGTAILIGRDTYDGARHAILARRIDRVAVFGRETGTEVYELIALAQDAEPASIAWIATYDSGLSAFHARRWDEAIALFRATIAERGDDAPSRLLIERARGFKADPPPPGWDGVLVLERK